MSYGIMPFAVSIAQVQEVFGSHDQALANELKHRFATLFEQDEDYDDEDGEALSLEQALGEIIDGQELPPEFGHKYGYAVKILCEHFGRHLPNEAFSSVGSEWIDEIEDVLADSGVSSVDFSLQEHLMYRGSPVPIPRPDDFPAVGYLKLNELAPALRAMQGANFTTAEAEHREALAEVQSWLETCIELKSDLVCFYH
jgi:hypothetical protein